MRAIRIFYLIVMILVFFTFKVFATDYFLYDYEKNKILFMGSKDAMFSEKFSLEKNPTLIMQTFDPNIFLCFFKGNEENNILNQLTTYNSKSGRTEDLVDLGCSDSYAYTYTKDRRHFFIAYKPSPDSQSYELLHYNIASKNCEKLTDIASSIKRLCLSFNEDQLLLLTQATKTTQAQLLTINLNSLKIQNKLDVGYNPDQIYVLGIERVALC